MGILLLLLHARKDGPKSPNSTILGQQLLRISQLSSEDLLSIINFACDIKNDFRQRSNKANVAQPLRGCTLSMIFQKRSTRTRVSADTAMFKLGGHAIMLGAQDIQLGANETLKDTALVLSRYNELILARVLAHSDIEELAEHSSAPVINALSDKHHPLLALADLMTLKEHFDDSLPGHTLAWVGDGSNVLHDLMVGCIKLDIHVRIATPRGYEPVPELYAEAETIAVQRGVILMYTDDPAVAVADADAVVTDTWVSMGKEGEAAQRKRDFEGFQVTPALLARAASEAVFLHCLPRKSEEVTDDVFYSERSLVLHEAENRMWTFMAVAMALLGVKWKCP